MASMRSVRQIIFAVSLRSAVVALFLLGTALADNATVPDFTGVWSGVGGNDEGVSVGAAGILIYQVENSDGSGVDTLVFTVQQPENNGTASCVSSHAVQDYTAELSSEIYGVAPLNGSALATAVYFNSTPGSAAVWTTTSGSTFCETGTISDAFTYVYTGNGTCPIMPGQPTSNGTTDIVLSAGLPRSNNCSDQMPSNATMLPSTASRDQFPQLPIPGASPTMAGYFATSSGPPGAGVLSPNGFSFVESINGTLAPVQGQFLYHECVGDWGYIGVAEKRIILPDGSTVFDHTCEAIEYFPSNNTYTGYVSPTECPTLNATTPGADWIKLTSVLVKPLMHQPGPSPCVTPATAPAPAAVPSASTPGLSSPASPSPSPAAAPTAATPPTSDADWLKIGVSSITAMVSIFLWLN